MHLLATEGEECGSSRIVSKLVIDDAVDTYLGSYGVRGARVKVGSENGYFSLLSIFGLFS